MCVNKQAISVIYISSIYQHIFTILSYCCSYQWFFRPAHPFTYLFRTSFIRVQHHFFWDTLQPIRINIYPDYGVMKS